MPIITCTKCKVPFEIIVDRKFECSRQACPVDVPGTQADYRREVNERFGEEYGDGRDQDDEPDYYNN